MRTLIWLLPLSLVAGCASGLESPPRTELAVPDKPEADPSSHEKNADPNRDAKRPSTDKPLDAAAMEQMARTDPIAFLEESLKRYDRDVRAYRVMLVKQEFLEGKLQPVERIEASFREKPFSVLMDWKQGARLARKTLYVKGENNDMLLAMPTGLLSLAGVQSRSPDSPAARSSSRFPITEFGIKIGSESTLKAWKAARKRGDLNVQYGGVKKRAELDYRPCWEMKRIGYREPEDDGILQSTYYFDTENWLQIGSILLGAKDRLIATYYFRDLQLNPELGPDTFSRAALRR